MKKPSEIFEGDNSSLKRTFDEAVGSDCMCELGSKEHRPECEYGDMTTLNKATVEEQAKEIQKEILSTTPDGEDELEILEQALTKAHQQGEREGVEKCRNCYSPDFSATDWDDAMKALQEPLTK